MKPLRQSSIDDLASLQMENELLMHEIRYLRARVTSAERAVAQASPCSTQPPRSPRSSRNRRPYETGAYETGAYETGARAHQCRGGSTNACRGSAET